MNNSLKNKSEVLGLNFSTATHQLKKSLMLHLAKQCNMSKCYRCGKEIETGKELSVDHKKDWLQSTNSVELFWDISNLAFSHKSCNTEAKFEKNKNRGSTKFRKKFQSRYWDNIKKKQIFIGNFDTAEAASDAAKQAKLKLLDKS